MSARSILIAVQACPSSSWISRRDGSTLRFAYGLETIRESAQLIKGCSELLFRALTIRNLGAKFLIHSRKHCGSLFISKLQQLLGPGQLLLFLALSVMSRVTFAKPRSCPLESRSAVITTLARIASVFSNAPSLIQGLSILRRFYKLSVWFALLRILLRVKD